VPVIVEPYPEYQSAPDEAAPDESDDQQTVAGPTVFDRGYSSNMTDVAADSDPAPIVAQPAAPPAPATQPPAVQDDSTAAQQPEAPQPPSVLVFRDGHQMEVENYAIVGDTLYDFTPGHARKLALSQLDLNATVQVNDDRGVDFVVPASAKSQ
jgi:hypothetical protein